MNLIKLRRLVNMIGLYVLCAVTITALLAAIANLFTGDHETAIAFGKVFFAGLFITLVCAIFIPPTDQPRWFLRNLNWWAKQRNLK
jgi:predicted Co/Zn/Cd cation transporter (cation efflux family)